MLVAVQLAIPRASRCGRTQAMGLLWYRRRTNGFEYCKEEVGLQAVCYCCRGSMISLLRDNQEKLSKKSLMYYEVTHYQFLLNLIVDYIKFHHKTYVFIISFKYTCVCRWTTTFIWCATTASNSINPVMVYISQDKSYW